MRRAAKVDSNHAQVVASLRQIGCHVTSLAAVGDGCPDLLVGYRGRLHVIEVKDGAKPPSQRRLTDEQVRWHAEARRVCVEPIIVTRAGEAIAAVVGASV